MPTNHLLLTQCFILVCVNSLKTSVVKVKRFKPKIRPYPFNNIVLFMLLIYYNKLKSRVPIVSQLSPPHFEPEYFSAAQCPAW